ncbi:MAG: hypothetical protein Q9217_004950 [Psora testacea]
MGLFRTLADPQTHISLYGGVPDVKNKQWVRPKKSSSKSKDKEKTFTTPSSRTPNNGPGTPESYRDDAALLRRSRTEQIPRRMSTYNAATSARDAQGHSADPKKASKQRPNHSASLSDLEEELSEASRGAGAERSLTMGGTRMSREEASGRAKATKKNQRRNGVAGDSDDSEE